MIALLLKSLFLWGAVSLLPSGIDQVKKVDFSSSPLPPPGAIQDLYLSLVPQKKAQALFDQRRFAELLPLVEGTKDPLYGVVLWHMGHKDKVCGLSKSLVQQDFFWRKSQALCQFVMGDGEKAKIAAELIRETHPDDPFGVAFLGLLEGDKKLSETIESLMPLPALSGPLQAIHDFQVQGKLPQGALDAIALNEETSWAAPDMVRALLFRGYLDRAKEWAAFLPPEEMIILKPLLFLAFGDIAFPFKEAARKLWLKAQERLRPSEAISRSQKLQEALRALGQDHDLTTLYNAKDNHLWSIAQEGQREEALKIIFQKASSKESLEDILQALMRLGYRTEAQRFALESLILDGF